MGKSPDAFRTISEVSTWLQTPPHVLRFWETKFLQVRPVKRAGGRRYYRPADMALLSGIKALLHDQGMTIKGVQKLLRERGPSHVASLSALPWAGEALEFGTVGPEDADADDLSGLRLVFDADTDAESAAAFLDSEMNDAEEDLSFDGAEIDAKIPTGDDDATSRPPTLIDGFINGTARRMAAAEPEPRLAAPVQSPAEAPLTPPSVDTLLALVARADPARLRERGDDIAPLLARLRALGHDDQARLG